MPGKKTPSRVKAASSSIRGGPPPEGVSSAPTSAEPRIGGITGWRLWTGRVLLVLLSPLVALGLFELLLRLIGSGSPTGFFLPAAEHGWVVENQQFARQFYGPETSLRPNPLKIRAHKPENTLRIFILGESAAAGTPDPSFGFGRMLEVMFRRQYPDRKIEIVNAAMRGINSHIVLPIARECARLEPDLFVVYMGNNEVVGLHAPRPNANPWANRLSVLRATQWLKATRLGQLTAPYVSRWAGGGSPEAKRQDMAYFRGHRLALDDPGRQSAYENFRANLDDICQVARACGAKVLLSTLAVNLLDCPPLASLHRRDLSAADLALWEKHYAAGAAAEKEGRPKEALPFFVQASALDDRYADLLFRFGRCCLDTGQIEPARKLFALARDWDAMQFRADSQINDRIRQIAARRQNEGVELFDGERALSDSDLSPHGIPGEKLFHEHVHFRFDGDYTMAKALFPVVSKTLEMEGKQVARAETRISKDDCAKALAYTPLVELQMTEAIIQLTAQPPFLDRLEHAQRQRAAEEAFRRRVAELGDSGYRQATDACRAAIAQNPEDWWLRFNFGRLCYALKDYVGAVEQLEKAVAAMPHQLILRMALADVLAGTGQLDAARTHLLAALKIDSRYQPAKKALTAIANAGSNHQPVAITFLPD